MSGHSLAEDDYEAYYREISDRCGCTELWECLSERRNGWTQPEKRG